MIKVSCVYDKLRDKKKEMSEDREFYVVWLCILHKWTRAKIYNFSHFFFLTISVVAKLSYKAQIF